MRNDTRALYNAYLAQLAQINGVPDATAKFTVEPTVQQRLETKMMESAGFLGMINVIGVDELKGEKVGLGVTGPIASRTDTSGAGERSPRDVKALSAQGYEAKQTNYDTSIRYAVLDSWAKFPDFQTRLRDAIVKQQALDRIMIGFNGSSAAATTNLGTNPLLQDVNIGWLKHIETEAPARVIDEVVASSDQITVGATGGGFRDDGEHRLGHLAPRGLRPRTPSAPARWRSRGTMSSLRSLTGGSAGRRCTGRRRPPCWRASPSSRS